MTPTKAAIKILQYLAGLPNDHQAETTAYTAKDRDKLRQLRNWGYIAPGGIQSGSAVTDKGRELLERLDAEECKAGSMKFDLMMSFAEPDATEPSKASTRVTTSSVRNITDQKRHPSYTLTFSTQIPLHIYTGLLGKSVPAGRYGSGGPSANRYEKRTFKKTITKNTLEGVCDKMGEVVRDYVWLNQLEQGGGVERVIFYKLDSSTGAARVCHKFKDEEGESYDQGYVGKIAFAYIEGFRASEKGAMYRDYGGELRFDQEKTLLSTHQNREIYDMKYVGWTEERQKFFDTLQVSFQGVMSRIAEFEEGLSEKTIDLLIGENRPLLGK